MDEDFIETGRSAELRVGLGLFDDHLNLTPGDLAFPGDERARSRCGGVCSGHVPDRLGHMLPGHGCGFCAEVDGASDMAVGEGLRVELRVGELADIV